MWLLVVRLLCVCKCVFLPITFTFVFVKYGKEAAKSIKYSLLFLNNKRKRNILRIQTNVRISRFWFSSYFYFYSSSSSSFSVFLYFMVRSYLFMENKLSSNLARSFIQENGTKQCRWQPEKKYLCANTYVRQK